MSNKELLNTINKKFYETLIYSLKYDLEKWETNKSFVHPRFISPTYNNIFFEYGDYGFYVYNENDKINSYPINIGWYLLENLYIGRLLEYLKYKKIMVKTLMYKMEKKRLMDIYGKYN